MALELFDVTIYLPIIVVCMIISQIYFERYWISYQSSSFNSWMIGIVIIVTYFIQELFLLQISLVNIHQVVFMQVVPTVMVFRKRVYKIWWPLMALTPLFVNLVEYFSGLLPLTNWWYWIIESITFTSISLFLMKWQGISKRLRYFMAIASLGIVELISLAITKQYSLVSMAAATLGLLVITVFEEQRVKGEVRNDQKIKLLQKESQRDDLTGLLNYRALDHEISQLTNNNETNNIVIGALDIDHFKNINDTYGHFVGNEVLNYFSTFLRKQIHTAFPKHGFVYRFGGEEFTIVVSNYSIKEVDKLLHQIERTLSEKQFRSKDGIQLTISFSCSITNHVKGELLDETLKRADKMLYIVKENGRGWINSDRYSDQIIANGTTS